MTQYQEIYEDEGPMPIFTCPFCGACFAAMRSDADVEVVPCPTCKRNVMEEPDPDGEIVEVDD